MDKNMPIKKVKLTSKPTKKQMQKAVRTLIAFAGDDPSREGVIETPARVSKAYGELFSGYEQDASKILSKTFKLDNGYHDIVLLRDIAFYSHCEHHLVPFFGKIHIAYLPNEGVVGLSKLARLAHAYARRLQTQENLTTQIIDALEKHLNPKGVAIMIEAEHMCMSMRGVNNAGVTTITQRFSGAFETDMNEREKFFSLLNVKR
jgi:GTP cyclohydrolase I